MRTSLKTGAAYFTSETLLPLSAHAIAHCGVTSLVPFLRRASR